MSGKAILWDFDGTLAHQPGMWGGAIVGALDTHAPGHLIGIDDVRALLRDGFPWDRPYEPHPHLSTPEAWWKEVGGLLTNIVKRLGFDDEEAELVANAAKENVIDPGGFHLFDDTRPALEQLAADGWRHTVLSNHVPELEEIVRSLGLADIVSTVLSSAITGYEKPHPEAFALALNAADHPSTVWMVGDNPDADVLGAEAVGIPAILVRTQDSRIRLRASNLFEVMDIIDTDGATVD